MYYFDFPRQICFPFQKQNNQMSHYWYFEVGENVCSYSGSKVGYRIELSVTYSMTECASVHKSQAHWLFENPFMHPSLSVPWSSSCHSGQALSLSSVLPDADAVAFRSRDHLGLSRYNRALSIDYNHSGSCWRSVLMLAVIFSVNYHIECFWATEVHDGLHQC